MCTYVLRIKTPPQNYLNIPHCDKIVQHSTQRLYRASKLCDRTSNTMYQNEFSSKLIKNKTKQHGSPVISSSEQLP